MLRLASLVVACGLTTLAASADDKPTKAEVAKRGKAATVLVEVKGKGTGSGFCVHPSGLFVSNEHVVGGEGTAVTLVMNSGLKDQRVIAAKVVRADKERDLALLRAEKAGEFPALQLGTADAITELAEVVVVGFPFGRLLSIDLKDYPTASVNAGSVTALRLKQGELDYIQLDVALNYGNSGGPVLDDRGRVIGVVVSALRGGAGINFAIPVTHLNQFLRKPEVVFTPPPIPFARRHESTEFSVRLVSFTEPAPEVTVEMTLSAGATDRKFVAQKQADGTHTVKAVPVPSATGPRRVPIQAIFPSGRVQGVVDDRTVKVGGQSLRLSELRELTPGEKGSAVTSVGREVSGRVSDLEPTKVDFGGYSTTVDLAKATRIVAEYTEEVIERVGYVVVVKEGNRPVAGTKGAIELDGRPKQAAIVPQRPDAPPVRIDSPSLAAERTEVPLPSTYEDVWVGGGGRYLIFHMRRLNQFAIFDVSAAKIVHYLPAPAEALIGAAGAEKFVVIVPGKRTIVRWNLRTFEKEMSVPLPVEFNVERAALGSASRGPLLVWGTIRNSALIDLDTLKVTDVKLGGVISGNVTVHVNQIEAAADGSAFVWWNRRQHGEEPSKFRVMRIEGGQPVVKEGLSMLKPCLASVDGGPVFTGEGNVYTADMQPIPAPALKGATLIPVGASYVVAARWEGDQRKARLTVHFMDGLGEAFTIGDVEELDGQEIGRTDPAAFSYEKRIQFVPSANVLLTLPATNDKIVIRRFDVEGALKKSPTDYLFVASSPVRHATRGTTYDYQIEVKSKAGDVAFELESAPKAMTLSKTGQLTWEVPAEFPEGDAAVIISITDKSGKKVFHSFSVKVRR